MCTQHTQHHTQSKPVVKCAPCGDACNARAPQSIYFEIENFPCYVHLNGGGGARCGIARALARFCCAFPFFRVPSFRASRSSICGSVPFRLCVCVLTAWHNVVLYARVCCLHAAVARAHFMSKTFQYFVGGGDTVMCVYVAYICVWVLSLSGVREGVGFCLGFWCALLRRPSIDICKTLR